jgi:hypothetical protein
MFLRPLADLHFAGVKGWHSNSWFNETRTEHGPFGSALQMPALSIGASFCPGSARARRSSTREGSTFLTWVLAFGTGRVRSCSQSRWSCLQTSSWFSEAETHLALTMRVPMRPCTSEDCTRVDRRGPPSARSVGRSSPETPCTNVFRNCASSGSWRGSLLRLRQTA